MPKKRNPYNQPKPTGDLLYKGNVIVSNKAWALLEVEKRRLLALDPNCKKEDFKKVNTRTT